MLAASRTKIVGPCSTVRRMRIYARRGRHAEPRSLRELVIRCLLLAFAADVLLTPMEGGSAPGPRFIAVAGLVVAAVCRHPSRRGSSILFTLCTGATALSMAGMGVSFDMAFSRNSEPWLNSATLWTCAAAVCGLCAWRYSELRSRADRDELVAAIARAVGAAVGTTSTPVTSP